MTFTLPERDEMSIYGFADITSWRGSRTGTWAMLLQLAEAGVIKFGDHSIYVAPHFTRLFPEESALIEPLFGEFGECTFNEFTCKPDVPIQCDPGLASIPAFKRLTRQGWLEHSKSPARKFFLASLAALSAAIVVIALVNGADLNQIAQIFVVIVLVGWWVIFLGFALTSTKDRLSPEGVKVKHRFKRLTRENSATRRKYVAYLPIGRTAWSFRSELRSAFTEKSDIPDWWLGSRDPKLFARNLVWVLKCVYFRIYDPRPSGPGH